MFEHPSFTYNTIAAEQERVDRANELRRVIAANPSRVVPRTHPVLDRMRGWLGVRRVDAAVPGAASGGQRVVGDNAARPAHAR